MKKIPRFVTWPFIISVAELSERRGRYRITIKIHVNIFVTYGYEREYFFKQCFGGSIAGSLVR